MLMNKKETGWDCDREATRHRGIGAYLSLSMSVKDRFVVSPHVMLNACLRLSWLDKSFRLRSRVAQFRPGLVLLCAPCGEPDVSCTKGDLRLPSRGMPGFVLGINS